MARFMAVIAHRECVIGCHNFEGRDGEKSFNMVNTSQIYSPILPTQHVSYSYKMVTPHKTAKRARETLESYRFSMSSHPVDLI